MRLNEVLIHNMQGGPKVSIQQSQPKFFKFLFTIEAAHFKALRITCEVPRTEIRLPSIYHQYKNLKTLSRDNSIPTFCPVPTLYDVKLLRLMRSLVKIL